MVDKKVNSVHEVMGFIFKSDIRFGILKQLCMSPMDKKELNSITYCSYAALSHHLETLKKRGFIIEENHRFRLADDFKVYFENLLKMNRSVEFIWDNRLFLNSHKIFNIDSSALSDLSPLGDMELISNENNDVFKVSSLIKDFLMESKTIKSVFPYLPWGHDEIFGYWRDNKVDVNLILSKEVYQSLKSEYDLDGDIGDFSLDVKIGDPFLDVLLALSDKGVLLGFYKNNGDFDGNSIFFSRNEQVMEWAEQVFEACEESCDEYVPLEELPVENNAIEVYLKEEIKNSNLLKFITYSPVRTTVLFSLMEGSKRLIDIGGVGVYELRNLLRVTAQLIELGLVSKTDGKYSLTNSGRLIVLNFERVLDKFG